MGVDSFDKFLALYLLFSLIDVPLVLIYRLSTL